MKYSIEHHREVLKNSMRHTNDLLAEIERLEEARLKICKENIFLAAQINYAVQKGYDGFDDSRIMKDRRGKI